MKKSLAPAVKVALGLMMLIFATVACEESEQPTATVEPITTSEVSIQPTQASSPTALAPSPTPEPQTTTTPVPSESAPTVTAAATTTSLSQPTVAASATPSPAPVPTPLPLPTVTPVPAPTPVPTATPAPTTVPTAVPVPTATTAPTTTPTPVPTTTPEPTATPTPEPTATPTATLVPTATAIPAPTATPIPTSTPVPVDSTAPVFLSSGISSDTTIDIGETFSFNYSVTDSGGSGLLVVELARANDNNGTPGEWTGVAQAAVNGTLGNGTIIATPGSTGSFWYRLQVFDSNVNFSLAENIGPVIVEPLTWPAPAIISPIDGSENVSTTPTLSWASVTGTNKYWITFADSLADLPTDIDAEDCPNCTVSIITTATSYTPSIALANGSTFYWRVQAFNDVGNTTKQGFYTPATSFKTLIVMATLSLYMHDGAGGTVLQGVDVTGTDANGTTFSGTTDANGLLTITGAAGTWNFTAVKSGKTDRSWSQSIVVTGDVHAFM